MNTNEHELFTMKNMKAMKEIAATCGRLSVQNRVVCSMQASVQPPVSDQSGWRRAILISACRYNVERSDRVLKGGREQDKERSDV